ncbi:unnamed protein product [Allacma fusca]|uniref:Uncharacterized protein n=1 Tax=Allacma fusca TaxID=39272 RepID=A0A8J2PDE9_9HEXA|nr:unnamed protein product [Allacma fusca]
MNFFFTALVIFNLPLLWAMWIQPVQAKERRSVLFSGWQHQPQLNQYFFPRTENYYHKIKPEAVVEILLDSSEDEIPMESSMVEHSSLTTSVKSQAEYKSSCVKEPGCRWECEPRQDELPPDCDCVCSYFQAYWDNIP